MQWDLIRLLFIARSNSQQHPWGHCAVCVFFQGTCVCVQVCSTHPTGLLQQEVEGVLNDVGCLQLSLTQWNQIAFHVIIHVAIQDLEMNNKTTKLYHRAKNWIWFYWWNIHLRLFAQLPGCQNLVYICYALYILPFFSVFCYDYTLGYYKLNDNGNMLSAEQMWWLLIHVGFHEYFSAEV